MAREEECIEQQDQTGQGEQQQDAPKRRSLRRSKDKRDLKWQECGTDGSDAEPDNVCRTIESVPRCVEGVVP